MQPHLLPREPYSSHLYADREEAIYLSHLIYVHTYMEHCCLVPMCCSPHHCGPCWQLGVPRLLASRRRVQKGPPAILGQGTGVSFRQRAAACSCLCTGGSTPLMPVRYRPSPCDNTGGAGVCTVGEAVPLIYTYCTR